MLFVGTVLALFSVLAILCWMLVRTNGPRTFIQHHHIHEDPTTAALNRAKTVGAWQLTEARQQALDDRRGDVPPASIDPLSNEYDEWLANRSKALGK